MRTLGVDLATEPERTGVCVLSWSSGDVRVASIAVGATDHDLLAAIDETDQVGIDAPFGWPAAFTRALGPYADRRVWPGSDRRALRLRSTDRFVHELTGLTPMSVSADRIGATAMRCAWLLSRLADGSRLPDDPREPARVAEVYPAAALKVWGDDDPRGGLVRSGYKGRAGARVREQIVEALAHAVGSLVIDSSDAALCRTNDDALDALICSLVARALALGLTHEPPPEHAALVGEEGWIHVPRPGSLAQLLRQ